MPKTKLTNADFCRASKRLRCEVAAIKAVSQVESRGEPFYDDGFPVILFERHKFRAFTKGRFSKDHPDISGPAGGYGKAGQNQRNKFNKAFALDPDAAMKSCSWGQFQIMGFNHELCGYRTVGAFVDAMKAGVDSQLDAFVSYVLKRSLDDELRRKNFYLFAEAYNGPNQEENNYSGKMETAYKKFAKENINCNGTSNSTAAKPADNPTVSSSVVSETGVSSATPQPSSEVTAKTEKETSEGTQTVEVTQKNEQNVHEPTAVEGPKPYNDIGLKQTLINDAKPFLPANVGLQSVSEYAQQATGWPPWVIGLITKIAIILLVVTVGWFIYRLVSFLVHRWQENERVKLTAQINSDVTRKNVEIVDPPTGGTK